MKSTISVSGQLVDIPMRFVEGSLSFMRKIIAVILIIKETESIGN